MPKKLTVGGRRWKGGLLEGIEKEIGILVKGSSGPIALCKMCQLHKTGYKPMHMSICCLSPGFHANVWSSVKLQQIYSTNNRLHLKYILTVINAFRQLPWEA